MTTSLHEFGSAYAQHRAVEGHSATVDELVELPYQRKGVLAKQWRVRARTFDAFVQHVLARQERATARPLRILDLGSGNGWLCYRVRQRGHNAVALDIREDYVDGLGAAGLYSSVLPEMFSRVAATFEELPFSSECFDIAVFNASVHYALDLADVLCEAVRVVRSGGRLVILDSPFYRREFAGEAMVAEKRLRSAEYFGDLAPELMSLEFIEYLTPIRLDDATRSFGLRWRRHRVLYPLWYEMRPLVSAITRKRPPSRFDMWEAIVS